jgi:hypothetical protein
MGDDNSMGDVLRRFEERAFAEKPKPETEVVKSCYTRRKCPCRSTGTNYCIALKTECSPDKHCERVLNSPGREPITPTFEVWGWV